MADDSRAPKPDRPPPPRITIGRLMLAVALSALIAWIAAECRIPTLPPAPSPAALRLQKLINHHDIRAQTWEMGPEFFRSSEANHEEFRALAAWHRRRIRELRNGRTQLTPSWWAEDAQVSTWEEALFHKFGGTGMAPAPASYNAL